nr:urocanate hydratase [Acidobacteriota bacterium]
MSTTASDRVRFQEQIRQGLPPVLPDPPPDDLGVDHAPPRRPALTAAERALALANALRYVPVAWHAALAPEFAEELKRDGKITMRRLRPRYP